MANSLGRNINPGEVVMMKAEYFQPGIDLRFRCKTGFGLLSLTSGGGIVGEWVEDGVKDRVEGYMIDSQAETNLPGAKKA